jgi:hypothetical protein
VLTQAKPVKPTPVKRALDRREPDTQPPEKQARREVDPQSEASALRQMLRLFKSTPADAVWTAFDWTPLEKRITNWKARLGKRHKKSSTAQTKRQKLVNETGKQSLLMFTHTAPPHYSDENTDHQGKTVYPVNNKFGYFRTGNNAQTRFLETTNENKTTKEDKSAGDKKQYVFVKEPYNFFNELYEKSPSFGITKNLNPDIIYGADIKGRFMYTGLGSEVNSYAKQNLLETSKTPFRGELLEKTENFPKRYIDNQSILSEFIKVAADPKTEFQKSYTSTILEHYREIVGQLAKIDAKNFNIVVADPDSGFLTYPALIIEPKSKRKLTGEDIKPHMKFIMSAFNQDSKVKMYERNSFGFLYPTISDLQRSIRLWPGQLDPTYYVAKLEPVLKLYDAWLDPERVPDSGEPSAASDKPSAKIDKGETQHATLFSTLSRTMAYISNVLKKTFRNEETLDFLQQRLATNLTKAQELLMMQDTGNFHGMDKADLFLEITQIIENLNEYGLQLVELQDWEPTEEEFYDTVKQTYGTAIKTAGYHLNGASLTHSGMQAGMAALNLRKRSKFEIGPVYFEFRKPSFNRIKKNPGLAPTGHYDAAYNFTNQKELNRYKNNRHHNSNSESMIIDITNVKPSEVSDILKKHPNTPSIYLYASLSKHFQLGMDRFTLGLVMDLNKTKRTSGPSAVGTFAMPVELRRYFILMQQAHNLGLPMELPPTDGPSTSSFRPA